MAVNGGQQLPTLGTYRGMGENPQTLNWVFSHLPLNANLD